MLNVKVILTLLFKKEDKKMKKQIAMLMGFSCMAAIALSCAKESAEVKNPSER